MSDDFKVFQNRADMNVIFVHSELDDRNLSAAEFRVYCHLARRSGGGKAWPGIDSMSRICNLARGTIMDAIRTLEAQKMIVAERQPGICTRYILTRFGEWEPCTRLNPFPKDTSPNEGTERIKRGHATSPNEGTKGNPLKVIPEGDTGRAPAKKVNGHRFSKPSIEEIKSQAAKIGLPESEADAFFNYQMAKGWKVGNSPMQSWTHALSTWKINAQKYGNTNNQNRNQPRSRFADRNKGTLNEGQGRVYAEFMERQNAAQKT